ncbi:MAG TPA: S8 family serine peptidase [Acidimicrobiales bacterium]
MAVAWADAFEPDRLGSAPSLDLPCRIDREWAFGGSTGAGVKVAVVDSGIDATHPRVGSVTGGVVVELDADAESGFRYVEGRHDDVYGHGTACAGIIRSLAPEVELYSVRVLGTTLKGSGVAFAAGLWWAIDNEMDVVNLSLSSSREDYWAMFGEAVDAAAERRTVLVAAMNNERKLTIPSQFSSVLSVACHPGADPEAFSCNPNPPAEWGAPGMGVEVPWLDGGSITATGNSFAAPHIAGQVARLLGNHPRLTPWQVRTVLAALADNSPTGPPIGAQEEP